MSWRCQTHGHYERAPVDELDHDGWSRLLAQVYLDEVPNQTNAIDAIDTRQIYDSWASLICDYSRCFLSVDNDKLPAIAGLAELYGRKFGTQLGTYIAGMWSAYLIESLRWRIRPAKKNFRRPASYRASTWSWASVNGVALARTPSKDDLLVHGLLCRVELEDGDFPYGMIGGAKLELAGPMAKVDIAWENTQRTEIRWGYDLSVFGNGAPGAETVHRDSTS
jgi:hypothetical protein